MRQISILGCGWLGFPLAKSLVKKGFSVQGSTTSSEKRSLLQNAGITPFQIALFENKIVGEIDLFLKNSEILIIDIPPKLRSDAKENFVGKIQMLIPFIEKSSVRNVLFVSSTTVYADDNTTISESTAPHPTTESGKQLLETEQLLQSNFNQTTIVRFGGLIGEQRHPIHFLSGRKNLENADAPINLIHQEDCIGIIEKVMEKECWNEVFNAVAPHHPTRKKYYTQKAIDLNLPLPEFDENKTSVGKIISSEKLATVLNYKFKNDLS
jgi:nucleoside-diphosphate-sugar epimerase